ncbi:MAG: hypothetical protein M1826_002586 [Phylliscum demangeonii]|nr:MAG: hypothetical protein M1826_002586 [Phylliscum demangeonii]
MVSHAVWSAAVAVVVAGYVWYVRRHRYDRLRAIKTKYAFTDDARSFAHMTPDQAQEIEHNLAEHEMPWLYEFAWLFDFLRTGSTPPLSIVIGNSGHFVHEDTMVAHRRQQDTVCLMNAFLAQPLGSEYSSLAIARINVHHAFYPRINSDTVLYLIWHFWRACVRWIDLVGWRRLEAFEVVALWYVWREIGLRMGCKYMPDTIEEVTEWSEAYRKHYVYPHKWNAIYNGSILDMFTHMAPAVLRPLARNCIMALLDEDIIWACGWESYCIMPRAVLRPVLLGLLRLLAFYQRWLCLPRRRPYRRSPSAPNPQTGLFNFPDYTYETSPFYVRPTWANQWSAWAMLNRLRGIGVPGPKYDSDGIAWESMGARRPTEGQQSQAEVRVRAQAKVLMAAGWGYRACVPFQARPLVPPLTLGYGSREHAFPADVVPLPLRSEPAEKADDAD